MGKLNKKILYNIINEHEKINFVIDTEKKTLIENLSYSKIKKNNNENYKTIIDHFNSDIKFKTMTDLQFEYDYNIQDNNIFTVLYESIPFPGDEKNGYKIFVYYYFLKDGFVERYRFIDEKKILSESYSCKSDYSINNGGISSGTAFFVSEKGHLLTNEHVVDGCKISKISYQGKEYDTELIASDKKLDLALLKAKLENKSYIDFSDDEPSKMQKIYVGGYPHQVRG